MILKYHLNKAATPSPYHKLHIHRPQIFKEI